VGIKNCRDDKEKAEDRRQKAEDRRQKAEGSPNEKILPSSMKIPQLRLPHNRCQPSTIN